MSELNDFIQSQHARDLENAKCQARTEQMLIDMNTRLFGSEGQKGVLPYIIETAEKSAKEAGCRFTAVETRTTALETWKTGTLKWVGGAVAVLTLEGTALAFYFNSVAKHVQAFIGK